MKTAIALSGGVDSAVAAYLLKQQGHDLVGVFMRFWHEPNNSNCTKCVENKCCSRDSLIKIKKICLLLNIPLLIFNFESDFKKSVVDKFIKYYQLGKTPNPCVWCNEEIKFKLFLKEAKKHGMEKIATGHYAGIKEIDGHYYIQRGQDKTKDQSYFLYRLNQKILKHTIFPLSQSFKKNNIKLAVKAFPKLNFQQQPESQDLCFYPESSYKPFLLRHSQKLNKKGRIIDLNGQVIGQHDGLINFTIGQRKGIKIGGGPIYYVKEIDVKNNRLIVADKQKLLCDKIFIKKINKSPLLSNVINGVETPHWSVSVPENKITAQIRYGHRPVECAILSQNYHSGYRSEALDNPGTRQNQSNDSISEIPDKSAIVQFAQPQFAPAPGQHCVFYQNNLVIGGGEIK